MIPDLTPEEADHCPYCGAVLTDPPNCCEDMEEEWRKIMEEEEKQKKNNLEDGMD